MRRLAPFVVLLAGVIAAPGGARAWTDATVRSASAHVTIAPDATAEVEITAQVRVDGGWLRAFEMDGLDADLELLPQRASFREAAGARLSPRVEHDGGGRVVFAFGRRDAPRRGDFVATVAYRTSLAGSATEVDDEGRVIVRWVLPGWRYGLDDVSITLDAPAGAQPVRDDDDLAVEVSVQGSDAGTRVVFHRVHLPRTREWSVALAVPADRMDAALSTPIVPRRPPPAPAQDAPRSPWALALLALALALLALAKIHAVARGERRARVASSALVPLGSGARSAIVVVMAAGAALAGAERIELALAALGAVALSALHRRAGAPRAPRLGSFRATAAQDHARARRARLAQRLGPEAWVDATTVPGAALLGAIAAAPALAWSRDALPVELPAALVIAALAVAVLLGGSRRARPASPQLELAELLDLAARVRADLDDDRRWALRPVLHADVRGEAQDARLRVVLPNAPKGLLRVDVVLASRADRGGWSSEPVLLVVAREGSPADRALEQRFPDARVASAPRRVARQLAIAPDLARTLAPLLECLATCPVESAPATKSAPALAAIA